MSTERSFAAPVILADEVLEQLGRLYLANPHLRARGVLFETFLQAPAEILRACGRPYLILSRRGLLPSQQTAQQRLDFDRAIQDIARRAIAALPPGCRCADGVWMEKLRHRAHPRGVKRFPKEVT